MSQFLVVGAGAIGSRVARSLSEQGHDVTCVSRGGRPVAGATSIALDATDAPRLAAVAAGVAAIFNCANPAYHRWLTDWPPLANALLSAAESSGATLVTLSNLYGYGRVSAPMTPETPLTAQYAKAQVRVTMWNDALAAHREGRIHACEVRASDYIGPGSQGVFGQRVIPRLLAGRGVSVIGALDQPHSWTFVDDVATTLVTCALRPETWGRVWHVPTNAPRTQRQVIDDLCIAAGVKPVRAKVLSPAVLRLVGVVNPIVRELPHTLYQFTSPFVIDDTATRAALGQVPTPWSDVLRATVDEFTTSNP